MRPLSAATVFAVLSWCVAPVAVAQQPPVQRVRGGFPALPPPGSDSAPASAWQISSSPTPFGPSSTDSAAAKSASSMGNAITVGSSLAIVLGLFFAAVWIFRSISGRSSSTPVVASVLQPIGGYRLDPRTNLTLLRCGRRVLLICQTAGSTTTLAEFNDPDEVAALLAQCDGKSRVAFEKTLESIGRDKHAPGFVDPVPLPAAAALATSGSPSAAPSSAAPPRPAPRTLFQTA